jgi:integrase
MRWDQIRWDAGVTSIGHRFAKVILEEHKTAEKTEKLRTIYLTPSLTRALRRVSSQPGKHPTHVFVHARGSRSVAAMETPADLGDPWNSIALAAKVRKVRERAIRAAESLQSEGKPTRGLELLSGKGANRLVNYRWRHTAISTLLMMGVDVATVAELTGTSPEMIHQHYGHLLDAHLAGAAEKLIRGRRA